jgi:hypothetical protein
MPYVNCTYCGKQLWRSDCDFARSKHGRFYCNTDERDLWWKENGYYKRKPNTAKRTRFGFIALKWNGKVYE